MAQVFSFEFCKISKKTFSCRTPTVTASGSDRAQGYWDLGRRCLANLSKQAVASTSNL